MGDRDPVPPKSCCVQSAILLCFIPFQLLQDWFFPHPFNQASSLETQVRIPPHFSSPSNFDFLLSIITASGGSRQTFDLTTSHPLAGEGMKLSADEVFGFFELDLD
ncbi:hypothetical protein AVEN_105745-1 [Araneus ventricosus]|uniref:Uncharacterized protein n=1 Tax=Araneus ventricosus TaxID=182803 RepID=A0A4Y2LYZ7_ARAVE|nr:hypothetical protein AVEN_105745-1 [Araneus ventricosus]